MEHHRWTPDRGQQHIVGAQHLVTDSPPCGYQSQSNHHLSVDRKEKNHVHKM